MADEFVAVPCRICNLLDKLVVAFRPAKNFLGNLNDIAGMCIIQREDKRLGKIVKIGFPLRVIEHLRVHRVSVRLENQLNLRRIDDTPVQFIPGIGFFATVLDILNSAVVTGNLLHFFPIPNGTALGCRSCLNSVNAIIDIHAIGNGAIQVVVNDAVIVEKSFRLRCRGGC